MDLPHSIRDPKHDDGYFTRCGDCGVPETRGRPKKVFNRLLEQELAIRQLYEKEEKSAKYIADHFGCSPTYIYRALDTLGIQRRENGHHKGENHWAWKGGKVHRHHGYVSVAISSDSPYISMSEGSRNYVLEHRLVMAQSLGRPLRSDETVHHKNGQRNDNRIENLQLMVGPHQVGISVCCGDCGSKNIVYEEIEQ
jgi:HNH endonuclease